IRGVRIDATSGARHANAETETGGRSRWRDGGEARRSRSDLFPVFRITAENRRGAACRAGPARCFQHAVSVMDVVELSRLQFAPLTIGLAVILAIMESVFVTTGRTVWRDMVKFWGTLFGINFAMGVATGITMEFQFGTNWAYYSHYVGDVFGAPLAIEGIVAFFLEATFV